MEPPSIVPILRSCLWASPPKSSLNENILSAVSAAAVDVALVSLYVCVNASSLNWALALTTLMTANTATADKYRKNLGISVFSR